MIGALWTGISGLSSHQKALDNESNNIANVNTVGYKSSRISFADQMYQSKIGKGSIVQDAEKLYVQGNTKITGVEYDMMLEGDGFFTVVNKNTLGTAESFYTRAGNFRMGDNGTLQDAGGNEVQGWIMAPIDTSTDVTSTNPNTSVFTNIYNKMLGSKIIRHGTYVETVTAKATDYNLTAKSDSTTVFSGDGAKSKSSKVADIENAIKDYNNWLQKLKEEPDASSANSLAQVSQIDFKSGTDSIIGKDGDRIYAVIDGQTISTNFIVTNATQQFREDLWKQLTNNGTSTAPAIAEGLVDPTTGTPAGSNLTPAEIAAYDRAAGKIETYKALADLISNRLPVEATMAIDAAEIGTFNTNTAYKSSTNYKDMLKGIIQIKSLIPGQEFKITEVAEQSGTKIAQGNYQSTAIATKGSGIAAVQTSKDALSKLISGKQQDVYTQSELGIGTSEKLEYSITIYDKELGINLPIPNTGANPPVAAPVEVVPTAPATTLTLEDIITKLNADATLNKYVEARNVNGNLVIQTKNDNYDVEFTGNLEITAPTPKVVEANKDYSGREGAGAEFLEIVTKVDQMASKGSIQLRLDTLNISDSPFGEFSVDNTGLITMKQDGAEFAIGQVAIARFNNNRGLNPEGNNLYGKTTQSGDPIYNINNNKTAEVRGKALELSNADLSESLVNLMIFQRAFEANAKSITTSDELLNTLINLKR
ncbi:flagellar hook protein, epsilonproteobacterial variant [Aliarcobacter cibarius]|uniref:Flagellar hook protein FlgE n=1 Tax=Aliarcobacter cibarius TaxID=255507 RepID=A0A5J6RGL0_9BACT|nr:flagellar hook-basal body complex protein [Aliarcobacter cibarius]QEZ88547.1 flagellar hook protein, epsilonproteobacterial variant [Aliarcobacter cibarius]QKJ26586.1 flagellar hook protein, epsilonproteobacterial variant [Aliarcobacter cibarius]